MKNGLCLVEETFSNILYKELNYDKKRRRTKEPLDEGERREWKSWLKIQHSQNKDHGISLITSWQIDG